MLSFTDQTGRTIQLAHRPQRIVSLVPSQTELLFDLGLNEEVVGITKFCIHPQQWLRQKALVGGTKNLHLDRIRSLHPDLVLANKEENVKEQVEELARQYPVWTSDIPTLSDAQEMITEVGLLTARERSALLLNQRIDSAFATLPASQLVPVAYLIWNEPLMTVGGDTFISDMLTRAGFQNVFRDQSRYPALTMDDILRAAPALLFLSSEPFPFAKKHAEAFQAALPGVKPVLVDGEMFSWYGSRLQSAPAYFRKLHQLTR